MKRRKMAMAWVLLWLFIAINLEGLAEQYIFPVWHPVLNLLMAVQMMGFVALAVWLVGKR